MLIQKNPGTTGGASPAAPPRPTPAPVAPPPIPVVAAPCPPAPPPIPIAVPTPAVRVPEVAQQALAQRAPTLPAAPLPSYIAVVKDDEIAPGMENVVGEGASLPMLTIAQALSPQVQETHTLAAGDCYLTTDRDTKLFGPGDIVEFTPIHFYKEWVEFQHRDLGGGMMGRSLDPSGELAKIANQQLRDRTRNPRPTKEQQPSQVLESLTFIALFADLDPATGAVRYFPAAIGFSKSKHKVGKVLLTLTQKRKGVPLFGQKYSLTSVFEKNKRLEGYYNFAVQPAGFPDEAEYKIAEQAYRDFDTVLKARELRVKHETEQAPDDVEVVGPVPTGTDGKAGY